MKPILLLSPTPSIVELAPAIAHALGIAIELEVSDDANVETIIQRYPKVEIVVSRGGLSEHARQIPGISVVDITLSINELLSNLSELTARGLRRIGIVSRANLFSGAIGNFDLLGAHISIYPENDEAAIIQRVEALIEAGFEGIIGCRVAFNTARKLGVEAVFLQSGEVSIRAALQEAIRILRAKEREKLQAAQLAAIIDNIDEAVIAITPENTVSFFNRHAKRLCSLSPAHAPNFDELLALFVSDDKEQVAQINGNSVIARSIPLNIHAPAPGKVITLHEVSRIRASESKIRSSLHKKGLYARYQFKDLVGDSLIMQALIERAKTYAGHDSNLLIYGETGTGKEVFAQSIHHHSPRKKGPFVSINIASIPPSLLESELFGYVDGAFTGARKGGKLGLFELAHQGTLFLDEIGELAPEIQSRFLRVLQEREIMRLGDDKIIPIDVRIISATNRDLFQQTLNGSFRQDLYYRIHVVGLRIPPLRARPDDIPLIFEHYLQRFSTKSASTLSSADIHANPSNAPKLALSHAAKALLKNHAWPGNIRQLRNLAEVISYSNNERVEAAQLAEVLGEQESSISENGFIAIPESGSLKEMEADIIRSLLAKYPPEEVCKRLGISRVTLWRKQKIENSPR